MKYQEIEGNLIELALSGAFDVIAHGCNCQNTMGAGIAPLMAKAFGCDKFKLEHPQLKGDINKLGQIDFRQLYIYDKKAYITEDLSLELMTRSADNKLFVVNAYTQFWYGKTHTNGVDKPLDYEALTLCFRKMNYMFKGKHIGSPLIGCGLAGGVFDYKMLKTPFEKYGYENYILKDVKTIIQEELKDCKVTMVHLKK